MRDLLIVILLVLVGVICFQAIPNETFSLESSKEQALSQKEIYARELEMAQKYYDKMWETESGRKKMEKEVPELYTTYWLKEHFSGNPFEK